LVFGHLLVTVREAFAVAPGTSRARVVALCHDGDDAYGQPRLVCLAAASFARERLQEVQWRQADASTIVNDAPGELLISLVAGDRELRPLDLKSEPELAELIRTIDTVELPPNH